MRFAKIFIVVLFVAALACPAAFADQPVNGALTEIGGVTVLNLWGDHYEMGYAHGYLLGHRVPALFEEFFVKLTNVTFLGYERYRRHYLEYWAVPDWYKEEVRGLFDGARDAGVDLYVPSLGRDLDEIDIQCIEGFSDVTSAAWCTSMIAWGPATIDDPILQGKAAITRTADWFAYPWRDQNFFAKQTIILARTPDQGHATLSVSFPGHMACLSCMNDTGVSLMRLTSNHNTPERLADFSQKFIPLNIAMREALESEDPNGDGAYTVDDPAYVLENTPRSTAYNIMTAGPDPEADPPFVFEINHAQSLKRFDSDDTTMPEGVVAATQHMRKMYSPIHCMRFKVMWTLMDAWDGKLTLQRFWGVNRSVAVRFPYISRTVQSMIFIPHLRRVSVTYTDDFLLAPDKEMNWMEWDEVFSVTPSQDDDDDAVDDDDTIDDDDQSDDDDDEPQPDCDPNVDYSGDDDDDDGCGC